MESKLKLSKYNVYHTYEHNLSSYLLIYNSMTRKMIIIDQTKSNNMLFNVENLECLVDDTVDKKQLEDLGILIHEDIDEFRLAYHHNIKKVYSNDVAKITIIPTTDCNFRCLYCYQEAEKNYMSEDVVNRIIKYFNKNIYNYKILFLSWFGGEPLLVKDQIIQISEVVYEICKKSNVVFYSSITTNGYELDISTFIRLVKYGLRYYQITIDGNSESHNLQRPHHKNNDSFEKIFSNLIKIHELPQNIRFEIGVRINVSQSNYPYMREFIENVLINFKNDQRFKIIWQWVRDWGGSRIDTCGTELKADYKLCENLISLSNVLGISCYESISHESGIDYCEALFQNGFVINYDARILKCSLKTQTEEELQKNTIGYITDNSKMIIDEKKEYKWLMPITQEKCKICNIYPICMGNSCPYNRIYNNSHKCIEFKELLPRYMEIMFHNKKYLKLEI